MTYLTWWKLDDSQFLFAALHRFWEEENLPPAWEPRPPAGKALFTQSVGELKKHYRVLKESPRAYNVKTRNGKQGGNICQIEWRNRAHFTALNSILSTSVRRNLQQLVQIRFGEEWEKLATFLPAPAWGLQLWKIFREVGVSVGGHAYLVPPEHQDHLQALRKITLSLPGANNNLAIIPVETPASGLQIAVQQGLEMELEENRKFLQRQAGWKNPQPRALEKRIHRLQDFHSKIQYFGKLMEVPYQALEKETENLIKELLP